MILKHGLLIFAGLILSSAVYSKPHGGHHSNVNILEEYSAGPQLEGKAKVRIRFLIDNFEIYKKLNIVAVDLCDVPRRCERIKELSSGAEQAVEGQVIFGHSLTTTGIKGKFLRIYTKHHNNTKQGKQNKRYKLTRTNLKLNEAIELNDPYGYDFFINLKEVGKRKFKPEFLAYAPTVPSAENITLYDPQTSSVIEVNDGITVNVPEHATDESTIIGLEVNRAGYTTGSFIISPETSFNTPLSVEIAFDPEIVNEGNLDEVFDISLKNQKLSTEFLTTDQNGRHVYTVNLSESGLISILDKSPDLIIPSAGALMLQKPLNATRPVGQSAIVESDLTVQSRSIAPQALSLAFAAALPSDPCVNALNSVNAVSSFYLQVDSQAAASFNQCTNAYPNVHIVIYRASDARNTTVFSKEVATSGGFSHKLKRISDHASYSGAWAMINGFVWNGDAGFSNSTGDFVGTQYINGQLLSTTNSAEAAIGFTDKFGSFNWPDFFNKAANTPPVYSPYDYHVVSSTSSIIKGGVCNSTLSSPGPNDRWSAMGVRYDVFGDGYIVMLSSTSYGSTTPYDLCQVFKALDVPNAIRLDGSSATSLHIAGTHVNPIVGAKSFLLGSARHVLYGIGVK